MVKTKRIGHALPLLIERCRILSLHVLVKTVGLRELTTADDSLLDHLAAFLIECAFMGHFLVASARVFVHLVSLRDLVPSCVDGALGLG